MKRLIHMMILLLALTPAALGASGQGAAMPEGLPWIEAQSPRHEGQEAGTKVTVVGQKTIVISGASGETLAIYDVAGVRVFQARVDGPERRFDLNLPKGCYIVKVGDTVRKIYIRR